VTADPNGLTLRGRVTLPAVQQARLALRVDDRAMAAEVLLGSSELFSAPPPGPVEISAAPALPPGVVKIADFWIEFSRMLTKVVRLEVEGVTSAYFPALSWTDPECLLDCVDSPLPSGYSYRGLIPGRAAVNLLAYGEESSVVDFSALALALSGVDPLTGATIADLPLRLLPGLGLDANIVTAPDAATVLQPAPGLLTLGDLEACMNTDIFTGDWEMFLNSFSIDREEYHLAGYSFTNIGTLPFCSETKTVQLNPIPDPGPGGYLEVYLLPAGHFSSDQPEETRSDYFYQDLGSPKAAGSVIADPGGPGPAAR
jgi:hypothetical protein